MPRPFGPAPDIGAFEATNAVFIPGQIAGLAPGDDATEFARHDSTTGAYSLQVGDTSYTITLTNAHYLCVPAFQTINLLSNQIGVNFQAYQRNAIILGMPASNSINLERVLKIDRERDCGRGGAEGEARRRRISLVDLRLRSNEAVRPTPAQDRPRYFQNTLLSFAGTNGQTIVIESSANLIDWVPVATNKIGASSYTRATFPATNTGQFFRAFSQ